VRCAPEVVIRRFLTSRRARTQVANVGFYHSLLPMFSAQLQFVRAATRHNARTEARNRSLSPSPLSVQNGLCRQMRTRLLGGIGLLVGVVLGPIFWHLWIYTVSTLLRPILLEACSGRERDSTEERGGAGRGQLQLLLLHHADQWGDAGEGVSEREAVLLSRPPFGDDGSR
jgi:hypothetical protein